jgi:hypothetical protein
MQVPLLSPVTLEQVATQFQSWRNTKKSKFDPIPESLKIAAAELLPLYPKNKIIKSLKISRSIFDPVTTRTPVKTSAAASHRKRVVAKNDKTDEINFITFKLPEPAISSSAQQAQPTVEALPAGAVCQLIRPDGAKLIIQAVDDLPVIIRAFLCSS